MAQKEQFCFNYWPKFLHKYNLYNIKFKILFKWANYQQFLGKYPRSISALFCD